MHAAAAEALGPELPCGHVAVELSDQDAREAQHGNAPVPVLSPGGGRGGGGGSTAGRQAGWSETRAHLFPCQAAEPASHWQQGSMTGVQGTEARLPCRTMAT